jgi:hypothetical protein
MDELLTDTTAIAAAERVLAATGLVTSLSALPDSTPEAEARLAEIAKLYAAGGPLSEMIIAEREAR